MACWSSLGYRLAFFCFIVENVAHHIALQQDPDAGLGRWVFSGYVYLANTIIGFWRQSGVPVEAAGMQGSFMISKVGPEIQINDNPL